MEFTAKHFHATFSAISNSWHVDLEEIEFEVTYLKINGIETDDRLACSIQEIECEDVELEWTKNILTIRKYKQLNKKHNTGLFNPDMPRNLAKSVTVK